MGWYVLTLQVTMEITNARLEYDLQPQYSTYTVETPKIQPVTTCPRLTCTDRCEGMCDNDRKCGGFYPSANTNFPGETRCSDTMKATDVCGVFYSPFGCGTMRYIVGYHLLPKEIFKVQRVSTTPSLVVDVEVEVDYFNGTRTSRTISIDTSKPNTVSPILVIEEIKFYNNGISNLNAAPREEYIMTSRSTNHNYLVKAQPLGVKVAGFIGSIQCSYQLSSEGDPENCDAADNICRIDFSEQKLVLCGIDPVETTISSTYNQQLPLVDGGVVYSVNRNVDKLIMQLSSIGSLNMIMNGKSELISTTVKVVPECNLGSPVVYGCYSCVSGFWFEMQAKSNIDSGPAVVSLSNRISSDGTGK